MPIATPEVYAQMLGRAKEHSFAFPAINCVGSESINAALKGFADAGSDGIIQFSTGGAEFGSGLGVKDMVTGAVALAEFAHIVAEKYPITVALHTDHCPKDKLDSYVKPLLAISQKRVADGRNPLFQSHMWDGSAVPMDENLEIARELLKQAAAAKIILEIEIGVVGGEEDGVAHEINDKLYTTPEDCRGQARIARGCTAFRLRLPRRVRLAEVRDRGLVEVRGGEDERRHRHSVRVHPPDRRTHVLQLRRCAQGRRRGR